MICKSKEELIANLKGVFIEGEELYLKDKELIKKDMDLLVENIIFSSEEIKLFSCWLIHNLSQDLEIFPSSIQEFYSARGRGEFSGFTVPAINLRTLTYPAASAIFRVAKKYNVGAFIFEIAKSEIGYTDQRPLEYSSIILASAIKEDFKGPVFIQGDHFQLKPKDYLSDSQKEIDSLKVLIEEAISAGFYNIDIDSSTLVDLTKESLIEQQRLNFEVCGLFTKFIREKQPQGIDISIGGEIGEVGGKNSTPEELRAFMKGYLEYIGSLKGISKISVQTGTSHGGVVLPDGSLAQVKIDFDTLRELSQVAQKEFGLAGAVQHGASTLPSEAFHKFPEVGCAEIHLATQFQNIVYDNLPLPLKEEIYAWIKENLSTEKKPQDTEEQFIYKTRKKALGPFKKELFSLSKDIKENIAHKLEEEFDFLFQKLKIENTKELVAKYVKPVSIKKSLKDFTLSGDLGELEGAD
ncbi:MAG: aldolase [Candidatus Omnitrophota bacterium]|nr:MAG: aldolase [Candidatus Omnitrophota bacterium]